jgi:uncharacterized membrane protein
MPSMDSKVKFFGHPAHQQLVALPVGLLVGAVVFDFLHLLGGDVGFAQASYYTMAAGIVTGIVAAPFGLLDVVALPAGSRAARIGRLHGGGNVIVLALFAASWILRSGEAAPTLAVVLSTLALVLLVLTGWLGGELVSRLAVGVSPDAHADTPSSLDPAPRPPAATRSSG